MSMTKDERYIVVLYEATKQAAEEEPEFNRYEIGRLANLQNKAVDAICQQLVRANFIRKASEENIYITSNGIRLAEQLLDKN